MKKFLKILKRTGLVLLALLIVSIVVIAIFMQTAPQFGQAPEGQDLQRIQTSPNYADGQFVNPIETSLGSFFEIMGTVPDLFLGENLTPEDSLPVRYSERPDVVDDSLCYITWYGHSAFLVEVEGKRILLDPMLGETAAPVSFGTSRFPNQRPIPIGELTDIDFVILSHDHYDHLDYPSILRLKDHVGHYYTALGVGSHLKRWGIPETKITELDWWESTSAGSMDLIACPARHFSGRGITDGNKTLWASWVIKGKTHNLYFSGDSGYGPHFKEIGTRYGPFSLSMLECGQYNLAWREIHLLPEESVQAGVDLQSEIVMPIHWGAFALAVHPWTEPVTRFKREALRQNIPVVHPYIGERFAVGIDFPQAEWWKEVK